MNEYQVAKLKEDYVQILQGAAVDKRLDDTRLSEMTGISVQWVNKIMKGYTGCTVRSLGKICDALGVQWEDIINVEPDTNIVKETV